MATCKKCGRIWQVLKLRQITLDCGKSPKCPRCGSKSVQVKDGSHWFYFWANVASKI